MTLNDLWAAMARGEQAVLDGAYLHRVMRERGDALIKGREDIGADWAVIMTAGKACEIIADLGDMAVVRVGGIVWHHWVRREAGRIAFEIVVSGGSAIVGSPLVERAIEAHGRRAELFHIFSSSGDESPVRHIGSRIIGTDQVAVSGPLPNG